MELNATAVGAVAADNDDVLAVSREVASDR